MQNKNKLKFCHFERNDKSLFFFNLGDSYVASLLRMTNISYFAEALIFILIFTISVKAQTNEIFGKVTDNNNQPLIGVNVLVEGTILGVATNSKGEYKLTGLKNGTYRLIFSMIGFEKKISLQARLVEAWRTQNIFLKRCLLWYN